MSYFIPGVKAQEIDWMKVDLLDACSDPMFDNMGPDGCPRTPFSSGVGKPLSACPHGRVEAELPHLDASMSNNDLSGAAQLSTQVLNCTSADVNKRTLKCYTCGYPVFGDHSQSYLSSHARDEKHPAFRCIVDGCNQLFWDDREYDAHIKRPHVNGHGRVAMPNLNDCVECNSSCKTKADLLRHAKVHQHQSYGCECGARFSRLDVLNRHLDSYSTREPEYPCKYCKRHRGVNGFRRHDHLMQHIRNYHHHETDRYGEDATSSSRLQYSFPTCPHSDCPQYRGDDYRGLSRLSQLESKPFASQSAFTKHMREEHNESTFPCDVFGCGRVGRRGYFREKDLIKHRKEQHPDADAYKVTNRDTRVQCLEIGCGVWIDASSVGDHYNVTHSQYGYRFGIRYNPT